MKMNEKLEIMLSRKRIKKTDFAHSIGITYRAFANYLNGTRNPRAETLQKMADQLQLTPEFLKDDSQELELTVEEQFIRKICASDADKAQAAAKAVFGGTGEGVPTVEITAEDGADILSLLVKSGLCASKSDARRNVQQGGVTANDEKVTDIAKAFTEAELKAGVVLKRGKKNFRKVLLK